MQVHDWHDAGQHAFACRIDASPADAVGAQAGCCHLLIGFNPEAQAQVFTLPPGEWQVALDTAGELTAGVRASLTLTVPAHALVVLRDTAAIAILTP